MKYCGGGAGYVLSRALLRDWAPIINSCQRLPVGEDVSVGKVTTKKSLLFVVNERLKKTILFFSVCMTN